MRESLHENKHGEARLEGPAKIFGVDSESLGHMARTTHNRGGCIAR